jgi:cytosine/adenosine deaminase-related metal-dependent hydrolase
LGPHYSTYDVAVEDFKLAKDFGLIASMHCAGAAARVPDGWDRLAAAGLLGDNNNIVHGNDLTDAQLRFMLDQGVSFSLTPETEMFQGHGFPITGRLRQLGHQPSLGVDLESCISGDLFTVTRMAMATQRAFDNAESKQTQNKLPETTTITAREALSWITIEGARMLKMSDRIGSLTPGKQADVLMVRVDELNMLPLHDPVATLVTQTSLANVDTVLVAGQIKKRHGRLLFDPLRDRQTALQKSGDRIASELAQRLTAQAH